VLRRELLEHESESKTARRAHREQEYGHELILPTTGSVVRCRAPPDVTVSG
jgi:hypothetical protein